MVRLGLVLGTMALLGLATAGSAQHLHQHGGHFDVHQNVQHGHDGAGHLTDSSGHHIDGDGHHTGSIGVYENGSYDGPYHHNSSSHYPSYVTPSYARPSYFQGERIISSRVISPTTVISPPNSVTATRVTANRIPVPGTANSIPGASNQGRVAILCNPRDSGGEISYTLNDFPFTIKPGETQKVNLDRDWVVQFDNGLSRQLNYRLEEGHYDFSVNLDRGWDLSRKEEAPPNQPAADEPPRLPGNSIPVMPALIGK